MSSRRNNRDRSRPGRNSYADPRRGRPESQDRNEREDPSAARDEHREGTSGRRRSFPARKNRAGRERGNRPENPRIRQLATEPASSNARTRYLSPTVNEMEPSTNYKLVNFTSEGFLNVVENCWDKMNRIDSRISRSLPRIVFVHCMNQLLIAWLIRMAELTRQQNSWNTRINGDALINRLNARDLMIPAEVCDWISGLGKFKSRDGLHWTANVPQICIPLTQRRLRQRLPQRSPGGDFGMPNAANHNVYEIMISPLVTRRQIEACMNNVQVNGNIVFDPLPDGLMPAQMNPTENLLGYQPAVTPWHPETRTLYRHALTNWSPDDLDSRICYNGLLWTRLEAALAPLQSKMKFRHGIPEFDIGSHAMYGQITLEHGRLHDILRTTDGRLESLIEMDPSTITESIMFTYRRYRYADAPGTCFLAQVEPDEDEEGGEEGEAIDVAPEGWEETRNASYLMDAPFGPTFGDVDLILNAAHYRRNVTQGRYAFIGHELARSTLTPQ